MATETTDIQPLIDGLRHGKPEAYRQLVQHMGEPLLRYARRVTGDSAGADDVVQDALLRVYRMRRKLSETLELRGLCFRIVRNLARNAVRDRSLRNKREQEVPNMRDTQDPQRNALAREAWAMAGSLPEQLREVIELRFEFGLSRTETAAALELPEGTVATRQRTALEQLRLRLATVAPALALPELPGLLRAAAPSTTPVSIAGLEASLMNSIQSLQRRTTALVAAVAVAILLLCVVGGAAVAASGPTPQPAPVTAARTLPVTQAPPLSGTTVGDDSTPREHTPIAPARTASNAVGDDSSQPSTPPSPRNEQTAEAKPEAAKQPVAEIPAPAPEPTLEAVKVPPTFLSEPMKIAIAGETFRYDIELAGSPAPTLSASGLPKWLRVEQLALTGTPERADMGRVTITLSAENGVAPNAVQRFELLVAASPEITSTAPTSATCDVAFSYKIEVKAEPAATLSVTGAPSWLTLKGDTLSGTPGADDSGDTGEIVIKATNGIQPDAEQRFALMVAGAPRFLSTAVIAAKAGETYRYEIKLGGSPAPSLKASSLPKWLSLENGVLSGTPRMADIGTSRKITLRAENGIKPNAEQRFQIEVAENFGYVELPWGEAEAKKYFRAGLKFTVTGWRWSGLSKGWDPNSRDPEEYEVTGTTDTGYEFDVTMYEVNTAAGVAQLKPLPVQKSSATWAQPAYMRFAQGAYDEAHYTRSPDKTEKLEIAGKKYDALVVTYQRKQKSSGGFSECVSYWFLHDKPLLAKTEFYKVNDKGEAQFFDRRQYVITTLQEP